VSAKSASAVSLMVAKVYFVPRGTTVAGNSLDAGQ